MPTLNILSWNIKDFAGNRYTKHGNTILNTIYSTAGARLFDIIVVVEPLTKMVKFSHGDVVTEGAGLDGILALYFGLAAKHPAWRVVPLRASADPPKSDMIGVYYFSEVVDFTGPDNIVGPTAIVTKTVTPTHHSLPWGATSTKAGKVAFEDTGGTDVDFFGRNPYLVEFNTPERTARKFSVDVKALPGPNLDIFTGSLPDAVDAHPYRFTLQACGGTPPYVWSKEGTSALPAGLDFVGGVLSGTPTVTGAFHLDVKVADGAGNDVTKSIALTSRAVTGGLVFETAAALPDAVEGQPYDVLLVTSGGTGARSVIHAPQKITDKLPVGCSVATDGAFVWAAPTVKKLEFDTSVADSTDRGFVVVGLHAPPQARAPENSDAVNNIALIRDILPPLRTKPVVIVGDFNTCPLVPQCRVLVKPGKKNDPDYKDTTHPVAESTALNALTLAGFTSHKTMVRSSLKAAKGAGEAAYYYVATKQPPAPNITLDHLTTHAFDHILTIGLPGGAVTNVATVDLVALDPGFVAAETDAKNKKPSPIKGICKKYLWTEGVSDHYPVKLSITL
ncbi:putative Ig domain-containing protein [Pyxidicoccus sp. MSG2]|uniref:putative Ig domain-containing protein n=1 Tax=Pyxidicoccus sp. MSG2 TaxID=2996790 RepID=UPI00226D69C6|nr:putative Ig domain-containing protein [Pyxidicoccus sp. MSG2]MCY1018180.1 putative Ig domain-containing protein [Pyxidicoccus sp. MSG2]